MFVTYCDADHGGNKENGKSHWIYGQTWFGVVAWHSKLQPVVTWSITEAEYIAAGAAEKWFQNLLRELGYTPSARAKLCIDRKSALSVVKTRTITREWNIWIHAFIG